MDICFSFQALVLGADGGLLGFVVKHARPLIIIITKSGLCRTLLLDRYRLLLYLVLGDLRNGSELLLAGFRVVPLLRVFRSAASDQVVVHLRGAAPFPNDQVLLLSERAGMVHSFVNNDGSSC